MYFSQFPVIYYEVEINGKLELRQLVDITHNIRFRKEVLGNISLYELYDVKDGETPDIVADRVYGSSQYHWAIMLFNERFDYIYDWPMHPHVLDEYINETYEDPLAIHHYEQNGYIVGPTWINGTSVAPAGATAVNNRDYEVTKNDIKRRIKLISPAVLSQVIKEFKILI